METTRHTMAHVREHLATFHLDFAPADEPAPCANCDTPSTEVAYIIQGYDSKGWPIQIRLCEDPYCWDWCDDKNRSEFKRVMAHRQANIDAGLAWHRAERSRRLRDNWPRWAVEVIVAVGA